jgi:L-ascorbate metabolism protein UlaG (beta-lactamase superfamily)
MIFGKKHGSIIREFFDSEVSDNEALILYLRYSGVLIRALDKVIGFDIADLLGRDGIDEIRNLDLLLYTHGHYDHFEYRSCIELFKKTDACIVAEPSVANELRGRIPPGKLIDARPGESREVDGFKLYFIEGLHVGPIILYLVELNGLRIFHGGDSSYVPLKDYNADIAFLPVGKPSPTASPMNAFKMLSDLEAKTVIPIHGSEGEYREFEDLVKNRYPEANVVKLKEYSMAKVSFK